MLSMLRQASARTLDHALASVDAAELFASLDDRLLGPAHRTALRDLILERHGELSVPALANVACTACRPGTPTGPTRRPSRRSSWRHVRRAHRR